MSLRKALLILAAFVAFVVSATEYSVESVPDVHRADRSQFVANPDGILPSDDVAKINATLRRLRDSTSVEAMVVAIDAIDSDDADQFATDLFEHWGLGKEDKDNGLLILFVLDTHDVVIRPGYGLEGALPDIICGRILRQDVFPACREGHYGTALVAATSRIAAILENPDYAAEYASAARDTDYADDFDGDTAWNVYLAICAIITFAMVVAWLSKLYAVRQRSDYDKYLALEGWKPVFLILTAACIFIPVIVTIPFLLVLNHWRNHQRQCPNCGARMIKVDEVNDNSYLTPSQDLEERIGSVDYDVWLCPDCGETDILAYVNHASPMSECEKCHARTAVLKETRIVQNPTATSKGRGVKVYECLNCHNRTNRFFEIAPDQSGLAGAAAAATILGAAGRRSGGFNGGFGGGSFGGGFGGGHTGGGGASGRW